jgi:hypothetical protein
VPKTSGARLKDYRSIGNEHIFIAGSSRSKLLNLCSLANEDDAMSNMKPCEARELHNYSGATFAVHRVLGSEAANDCKVGSVYAVYTGVPPGSAT